MVYGLPTIDPPEGDWGRKVNASIEAVKETADAAIPADEKNAPSGVAPLDSEQRVPEANLPARLQDSALRAQFTQMAHRPMLLRDQPGIDFTGAADSAAALQAAFDAAGAGRRIEAGQPMKIRCDTTVTTSAESILDMQSFRLGKYVGHSSELIFPALTGSQVGLQLGPDSMVENALLRGPGPTANVSPGIGIANDSTGLSGPSHSARFRNVSVTQFGTAVKLAACYYGHFDGCEFAVNNVGVELASSCNNITFLAPRILCRSNFDGGVGGIGIKVSGATSAITIMGGAIEDYGAEGGIRYTSNLDLKCYGTYFESVFAGAFGFRSPSTVTTLVLALRDCFVNLNNHNRWVWFDAVDSILTSQGNRFASTAGTPIGYIVNGANSTATRNNVDIRQDSWKGVAAGATYCDAFALTSRGYNIAAPYDVATHGDRNYVGRRSHFPASTAAGASVNLPHGTAPTSPSDGDMWTTTAGLFVRINGATVGPLT